MLTQNIKQFCVSKQLTSLLKVANSKNSKRYKLENVCFNMNTDSQHGKEIKSFERYSSYLQLYGSYHPNPLSLQQLLLFGTKTGTEVTSCEFLRHELPVRLANIMQEINHTPAVLQKMPSFAMVKSMYQRSFAEILEFERADVNDDKVLQRFTKTLVDVRNRHVNVVETMAKGIMEYKEAYGPELLDRQEQQIDYFLNRFYINRISIRMLINQHALLYGSQIGNHPRHIGCIDPHCDVLEVAKDAFANARFVCEQFYYDLQAPDIKISCHNSCENVDKIQLVYVPSHLYHMLFELLKNSMRAVVETHAGAKEVPQLELMISKGEEDLTIKLSDQGGGIPYSKKDQLFKYMYTTATQPLPSLNVDNSAPLAGYGYGLPLSRVYARYFKGDLVINSVEGYGTDAFIYLKVLSDEANECLPVYNKTSSKIYESDTPVSDWSSPPPWTENTSNRSFSTYTRLTNHRRS